MSGHHRFSELEAAMTPQRRARVNRLAHKLDVDLGPGQSHLTEKVNYKRLSELSHEFMQLSSRLQAFYRDAVAGFAFVCDHVNARQVLARTLVAGTELDSEAFQDTRMFTYSGIFSNDFYTAGIHRFTQAAGIHSTQGEVKARNTPDGANFITLGQLCVVSFYDFWNDYLRREYVIAKGLLDPNETDFEIVQASLRKHASHDLWGDLYYLRTSIVHNHGIASGEVKKCKLITWFKPGDTIALTPEHMRAIFLALLKYSNELFAQQFPPRHIIFE